MKILGIGTLAMDILTEVDTLPSADGFAVVNNVTYLPGGSGTNVIVQSARLGTQTAYVAKLGDDSIGNDIITSLKSEGVETRGMRQKPNGTSLNTNVIVAKNGQKFILLNFGDSFGDLQRSELDLSLIDECDILFTDFYPRNVPAIAIRKAHKQGKPVVFNMQTGMGTFSTFGITRDEILAILPMVEIFAPCREGFSDLFGAGDPQSHLAELRKYFHGTLILTQGSEGVLAIGPDDQLTQVPAVKITPVDTTGAGDSFIGSFMVAYYDWKQPLAEALKTANACAAYTCMGLGARSGPDTKQLQEWMKKNY